MEKVNVEPMQAVFEYDAAGNLVNDGVRAYTWDGAGMLVSVVDASHKSDYQYDGLGRKVRATEYYRGSDGVNWFKEKDTRFICDGWNCVAEAMILLDGGPPMHGHDKRYVWGLDLSGTLQGAGGIGGLLATTVHGTPDTTHFHAYDGNGNTICTINCADGTISAHYEYDPFGRLVCKEGAYADDNEYRFSTKRHNAAWSMYDYGYRHYSPDLGRWMSRDPIEEEGGYNLFSYVRNDPYDTIDPNGLGAPCESRPTSINPCTVVIVSGHGGFCDDMEDRLGVTARMPSTSRIGYTGCRSDTQNKSVRDFSPRINGEYAPGHYGIHGFPVITGKTGNTPEDKFNEKNNRTPQENDKDNLTGRDALKAIIKQAVASAAAEADEIAEDCTSDCCDEKRDHPDAPCRKEQCNAHVYVVMYIENQTGVAGNENNKLGPVKRNILKELKADESFNAEKKMINQQIGTSDAPVLRITPCKKIRQVN